MSELKCRECGTKFDSQENMKYTSRVIYVEGSDGYEKEKIKVTTPKCPKCGSDNWKPTSIPAGDPLTREQALRRF